MPPWLRLNDMAEQKLSRDSALRRAVIILSILGLAVALYLVYYKLFPTSAFCVNIGDCEAVNTSIYSELFGIPVAAFGAAGYLAILLATLLENRSPFFQEWASIAGFGLALVGFLYSAYLTYIELFVIFKICPYCVASAVIMTAIFALTSIRLRKVL